MAIHNVHMKRQQRGIANVFVPSYPIRLQKSVSGFNAPSFIRVGSPIGTAVLRLAALMNKFFPYDALFNLSVVVEQLAPVKSYLFSVPLDRSRYIAPPNKLASHKLKVDYEDVVVFIINIPPLSEILFKETKIAPPFPFVLEHELNQHESLIVNLLVPLNSALIAAPFPLVSLLSILVNELSIISTFPVPLPTFIILYPDILIVETISLLIARLPWLVYTSPTEIDDESPSVIFIKQLVISIFVNVFPPVIIQSPDAFLLIENVILSNETDYAVIVNFPVLSINKIEFTVSQTPESVIALELYVNAYSNVLQGHYKCPQNRLSFPDPTCRDNREEQLIGQCLDGLFYPLLTSSVLIPIYNTPQVSFVQRLVVSLTERRFLDAILAPVSAVSKD
ncbi:MAG: hypothetical protein EZS28_041453 [Streblomastix strix]|uniref:Uncharacterized protein n=1 Tax=Streblomastix strix TaxID=222440 RepID=A0A5J4TY59_9EUKA|nr:MAG: hypothetical protein EZS28_041453 [Streblomastix strix]